MSDRGKRLAEIISAKYRGSMLVSEDLDLVLTIEFKTSDLVWLIQELKQAWSRERALVEALNFIKPGLASEISNLKDIFSQKEIINKALEAWRKNGGEW